MNLVFWQKKGYIKKIRNGWYCFADIPMNEYWRYYAANKIYAPSYISLESALSYYGYIPERVFNITSFTTLKTNTFNTQSGAFIYKTIKPNAFFGYKLIQHQNLTLKMAEPEKALLDVLYLNKKLKSTDDFLSFRLQRQTIQEQINWPTFVKYAELFKTDALLQKVELIKEYLYA